MLHRRGWTTSDLNWRAMKIEDLATLAFVAIFYTIVIEVIACTAMTLGGRMSEGWDWLWSVAALGALLVPTLLINAYPDPLARLCLHITHGPRTDTKETTS